jgi:hypothetical protein
MLKLFKKVFCYEIQDNLVVHLEHDLLRKVVWVAFGKFQKRGEVHLNVRLYNDKEFKVDDIEVVVFDDYIRKSLKRMFEFYGCILKSIQLRSVKDIFNPVSLMNIKTGFEEKDDFNGYTYFWKINPHPVYVKAKDRCTNILMKLQANWKLANEKEKDYLLTKACDGSKVLYYLIKCLIDMDVFVQDCGNRKPIEIVKRGHAVASRSKGFIEIDMRSYEEKEKVYKTVKRLMKQYPGSKVAYRRSDNKMRIIVNSMKDLRCLSGDTVKKGA